MYALKNNLSGRYSSLILKNSRSTTAIFYKLYHTNKTKDYFSDYKAFAAHLVTQYSLFVS